MLTRRQTLRSLGALGVLGVAAPTLTGCGTGASSATHGAPDPAGLRLVSADLPQSPGDVAAVGGVVSAMSAFTLDLWEAVGQPGANLALSPYSIAVALAMTANGARGATARQMLDVLHVDSLATYNAGMAALTQRLSGLAGTVKLGDDTVEIDLSTANQLFGNTGIRWEKPFLTVLAKQYGAGMRVVDFTGDLDGARELINGWTSDQTHDRIPEILPQGSIDSSTELVLVDALYFKAPWQVPFAKAQTKTGTFTRAGGSHVSAPMMSTTEGPAYVEGLRYRGARLAYAGGTLAMTVALPTTSESAALRELLTAGLHGPGQEGLRLTMPRWKYRVATDLGRPLTALGMGGAFSDGADFSAMTRDVALEISKVLHQTYVAVDEIGTEAAAATAVGMADSALAQTPPPLVLDRPFLYVVHDTRYGTPLFVGRVGDPGSS